MSKTHLHFIGNLFMRCFFTISKVPLYHRASSSSWQAYSNSLQIFGFSIFAVSLNCYSQTLERSGPCSNNVLLFLSSFSEYANLMRWLNNFTPFSWHRCASSSLSMLFGGFLSTGTGAELPPDSCSSRRVAWLGLGTYCCSIVSILSVWQICPWFWDCLLYLPMFSWSIGYLCSP